MEFERLFEPVKRGSKDCNDPANILHAIWDGYMIGRC